MYILGNEIAEKMGIQFFLEGAYQKVYVPKEYATAEEFALGMVYALRRLAADLKGIDVDKVFLVAYSKNNKIVVISEASRYRRWLYLSFRIPSVGIAQFYDEISLAEIEERLALIC